MGCVAETNVLNVKLCDYPVHVCFGFVHVDYTMSNNKEKNAHLCLIFSGTTYKLQTIGTKV